MPSPQLLSASDASSPRSSTCRGRDRWCHHRMILGLTWSASDIPLCTVLQAHYFSSDGPGLKLKPKLQCVLHPGCPAPATSHLRNTGQSWSPKHKSKAPQNSVHVGSFYARIFPHFLTRITRPQQDICPATVSIELSPSSQETSSNSLLH